MRQVVAIHGGDAFSSYDAYLSFLKSLVIESVEFFKRKKDWKASLQEALGSGYEVLSPQMPNKHNAKYVEWKLWFEKLIPFLKDGVILVGHSLGVSFLAKYLSENKFPKKIAATLLVAGPYDTDGYRPIPEFVLPSSLAFCEQQSGRIFLYHSADDPVVAFSEFAKYKNAFPRATARAFYDRKHFNQETFPELLSDIKSI